MIHVIAVITAKPGQRELILEAYRANRPAVLAEKGCIEYTATIDAAGMPASRSSSVRRSAWHSEHHCAPGRTSAWHPGHRRSVVT